MEGFKELGVASGFIKGLNEMGINEPTEIQKQVIPMLLDQNIDLVGQSQTGSGKTAAFGLPILHRIDSKNKKIQALVLAPTRELGQQIAKQLFKFTKYSDRVFTEAVFGGEKIDKQIDRLSRPTHIVVATPGRLIDLVKQRVINLDSVEVVVLDEADEMLSMGFKKELDQILGMTSNAECKWLFSATLPEGIKQIINQHLSTDAVRIELNPKEAANRRIEHQYIVCDEVNKRPILQQFLHAYKKEQGIVFCRTKSTAQELSDQLLKRNFSVGSLHGDMQQKEREKVLRAFRKGNLAVLVATDVAARGIDVPNLSYVVHFQMPDKNEYFTHRSGRTARAGNRGLSLCLVTSIEKKQLRFYQKHLGISFNQVNQIKG